MAKKLTRADVARLLNEHAGADSPGFLLWRASLRWQRDVAAALKDEDLTHVQFLILSTIWWFEHEGRIPSQREVSDHASVDRVMMSQVVRQLEQDRLVERKVDEADARVRRLRVTTTGRALAERSIALMDAADREFFQDAGPLANIISVLGPLAKVQSLNSE